MARKLRNAARLAILNAVFIAACFLALAPVLYALKVALSSGGGIFVSLAPQKITLDNFKTVLFEKPFLLWLKNSLSLSVATVVLSLAVAVPASYALSRFRFRGRKPLLYILLMLNAFPAVLSMLALYRILKITGLMNSFGGLLLIYVGTMLIFCVWNMKGYFDGIPIEIEEAARIDGAGDLGLIAQIILPLARPAIIVTAVMALIYVWNEYIFAVVFLTGANNYTLAAGLFSLAATERTRNWPLFSAASILVSLPVLAMFFMIQKYMISGLTAGGVKG